MTHRNHPASDFESVVTDASVLVDVREAHEVAEGSLPGAINIPLGELGSRADELDSRSRVVLLCGSGRRSEHAAAFLTQRGFADVVNLDGGMLAVAATR